MSSQNDQILGPALTLLERLIRSDRFPLDRAVRAETILRSIACDIHPAAYFPLRMLMLRFATQTKLRVRTAETNWIKEIILLHLFSPVLQIELQTFMGMLLETSIPWMSAETIAVAHHSCILSTINGREVQNNGLVTRKSFFRDRVNTTFFNSS
jgi:hypothetical protein